MSITITVRKDGPYRIAPEDVSQVRLVDHEGNDVPIPGKSVTLCRCGASTTKPFCDGTHSRIGFRAAEAAQRTFDEEKPAAPTAGEAKPAESKPARESREG